MLLIELFAVGNDDDQQKVYINPPKKKLYFNEKDMNLIQV